MGLVAVVLALFVLGACGAKQKTPALGQADADVFLFQRGTEELAKKHWLTARSSGSRSIIPSFRTGRTVTRQPLRWSLAAPSRTDLCSIAETTT